MKRQKRKAAGLEPDRILRMNTPERVAAATRIAGALWAELGRRLRELQKALDACGAGGEAPVLQAQARVKLMRGAWRALAPDARALVESPSGDDEHFRWMDEYSQVMSKWLATFESDLRDYGEPVEGFGPEEGFEPEDGMWFVPEVAVALGRVVEVYEDWSTIAWALSTIDAPGGYGAEEIRQMDAALQQVEQRREARRTAGRKASIEVTG